MPMGKCSFGSHSISIKGQYSDHFNESSPSRIYPDVHRAGWTPATHGNSVFWTHARERGGRIPLYPASSGVHDQSELEINQPTKMRTHVNVLVIVIERFDCWLVKVILVNCNHQRQTSRPHQPLKTHRSRRKTESEVRKKGRRKFKKGYCRSSDRVASKKRPTIWSRATISWQC
jgi:hypothetical protein